MNDDFNLVVGLLLHLGGFDDAPYEMKERVVTSINPVQKEWGIWQAQDDIYGLSWIVAIGHDTVYRLIAQRANGENWAQYMPSATATINDLAVTDGRFITATVASFHDSRHDVAPPALLKFGSNYVYRNVSGHAIPLEPDLVEEMLAINKIEP